MLQILDSSTWITIVQRRKSSPEHMHVHACSVHKYTLYIHVGLLLSSEVWGVWVGRSPLHHSWLTPRGSDWQRAWGSPPWQASTLCTCSSRVRKRTERSEVKAQSSQKDYLTALVLMSLCKPHCHFMWVDSCCTRQSTPMTEPSQLVKKAIEKLNTT